MAQNEEDLEEKAAIAFKVLKGEERFDVNKFSYRSEAALDAFKEILSLNPCCYDAWLGTGLCHSFWPAKYSEAISAFKRASEIQPDAVEPYYQIGLTLLRDGEVNYQNPIPNGYEQALYYLQKATELGYSPRSTLYNLIGTVYFRMERYEEAILWLKRSAELMKREGTWLPSTFVLAAEAYELSGDFSEALRWYELCVKEGFSSEEMHVKIKNLRILIENQKKSY